MTCYLQKNYPIASRKVVFSEASESYQLSKKKEAGSDGFEMY